MKNKENIKLSTAWQEFKEALHYATQAKIGKFSLGTYIKRLSYSIDDYIQKIEKEEDLQFQSGYIEMYSNQTNINFSIHLTFIDKNKIITEKILCKSIMSEQFTKETLPQLQNNKKVYIIDPPGGE